MSKVFLTPAEVLSNLDKPQNLGPSLTLVGNWVVYKYYIWQCVQVMVGHFNISVCCRFL